MALIKKAVIPAAGFGTRFLPQTKAVPKEMMPLVDKPIIQRVVEELVDAGIETIIIVTGLYKRSIEDHFDNLYELEDKLARAGKEEELEKVRKISDLAEFVYIRQKGPPGNATPILNARNIIGDDSFMVFWGDDFVDATPSRANQLVAAFEKYNASILSAIRAPNEEAFKKYAFADGEKVGEGVVKIDRIIEKPGSRKNAPSDLSIVSGYVFTPDIYDFLLEAKAKLEEGKEFVYTDGVQRMINAGIPVYSLEIKNAIYRDTGNKLEYLKTVLDYGLDHPEFGEELKKHLQKRLAN